MEQSGPPPRSPGRPVKTLCQRPGPCARHPSPVALPPLPGLRVQQTRMLPPSGPLQSKSTRISSFSSQRSFFTVCAEGSILSENNGRVRSWWGVVGEGTTSTSPGSHPRPGEPCQEPRKGPGTLCGLDFLSLPPGDPGEPSCAWGAGCGEQGVGSASSEALHKAAWEETSAAVPLQGPLVPAVLTLLVHKDDVAFLQLNFRLALGRI